MSQTIFWGFNPSPKYVQAYIYLEIDELQLRLLEKQLTTKFILLCLPDPPQKYLNNSGTDKHQQQ